MPDRYLVYAMYSGTWYQHLVICTRDSRRSGENVYKIRERGTFI